MLPSSSQKRSPTLTVLELEAAHRQRCSLSPSPSPTRAASARSLMEVQEEARWESCSPRPEQGRNVRARNVTERNRLNLVQTALDRQLERELKRLAQEQSGFSESLEQLKGGRRRGRLGSASSGSLPNLCLELPKSKAASRHTSPRTSPSLPPVGNGAGRSRSSDRTVE